PALGRQLVRAADAPLRGHGFGTSRLRQTPTTNRVVPLDNFM
ncbi:MAG: hypothetical protein, partial [Olavius algarvensis Gamma 1 endosymbiont]